MENTVDIAKSRVAQFQDPIDTFMADHEEAMNCMDCETFLQKGIDAIRWLTLAEQQVLNRYKSHAETAPDGFQEFLAVSYQSIAHRSEVAKIWIGECNARGYEVANATEFYTALEVVEDWLEQHHWIQRSARMTSED